MKNQIAAQAPANSQKANLKTALNNIVETLTKMVKARKATIEIENLYEQVEFFRNAGIDCARETIKGDWDLTTNYFTCGSNVFGKENFEIFRYNFFYTLKHDLQKLEDLRSFNLQKLEELKSFKEVNRFPKGRW